MQLIKYNKYQLTINFMIIKNKIYSYINYNVNVDIDLNF